MKKIVILLLFYLLAIQAWSCTTFIISGKYTKDGRPILFKHRDTGTQDNALAYFTDGRYDYIGLVDSNREWKEMVWGGYNSVGFAIMNSAAYNNNIGDTSKFADQEGVVMKKALMQCATLADFEKLLMELPKPLGVDANFGVIDAFGGAAYYETGNYGFKKIDANNPAIAPYGYIVRTNHSFTGDMDKGAGYVRFATASESLYRAAAIKRFDPEYIFNSLSRNLYHSLTGINLRDEISSGSTNQIFRNFEDFIPRNSTASVIMVVGSKNGGDPSEAMMWTLLGFPLTTFPVPVWVSGGKDLPRVVSMKENFHSPVCDAAMILKSRCFPVTRGEGWKYIDMAALMNRNNTGILQLVEKNEGEIYATVEKIMTASGNATERKSAIKKVYEFIDMKVPSLYKDLFGISF